MIRITAIAIALGMAAWACASGATYYVDSGAGNDANAGTSEQEAWRSLDKINRAPLAPGDNVLLRSGGAWRETLRPSRSGGQVDLVANTILGCELGIYVDGQNGNRPWTGTARRNIIANNATRGVCITDSPGRCFFYNNTIVNNGRHKSWNHHNVTLDGASNSTWMDNILCSTSSFAISINNPTHKLDHNCYFRPEGRVIGWDNTRASFDADTFVDYRKASGQDAHSIVADPRFVDAEKLDFRLRPDSPCAGKGAHPTPLEAK